MNGLSNKELYLSIVIPLFNEENNVSALMNELEANIQPLRVSFEIILVDDGSTDGTWAKIKRFSEVNLNVKGIRLARNFGHQHALLAGLSHARGQAIISMDGDLQHPPSLIGHLVEQHQRGNLVVNTCRNDKEVTSFFKRKTSSSFYRIFTTLTDVHMEAGLSDFRLVDRVVLNYLLEMKDVDLFLRGAVEWLGFPSVTVPYDARKRLSGVSKYSLSRMIKFARGSIISFTTKPLVIGVWVGIVVSILAFFEIIYTLMQVLLGNTVPGWASIVGIMSFLFSILFILLGIIGVYLARIHRALQNRPSFAVMEITGKREGKV